MDNKKHGANDLMFVSNEGMGREEINKLFVSNEIYDILTESYVRGGEEINKLFCLVKERVEEGR